ncbi:MAG: TonB-dependent receptor [Rhodobacteraceae bacterium]|nr:TonB-dependent receptor [Paracoccaceae bacterium]
MNTRMLLAGSAAIALTVDLGSTAYAQVTGLEEIVVTARKRSESLMEVPLAISAFSAATLEKMGLTDMTDLSTFTPGFHYVEQVGGGSGRSDRSSSALQFRGLFLGAGAQGTTAGALVFIDGAAVIGGQAPAFVDMERVEVLKGPQSAYFGRSVLSGAVNYITRTPSMDGFKGRVTASTASYGTNLVQLSLEGPVSDKFAIRLSGSHDFKGGQYVNASNREIRLGAETTNSVAAQLFFQPSDNLTAKGFFHYMRHDDGPPAQAALKASTGDFNCNPTIRGGYFCGQIPDAGDLPPSYISGFYDVNATFLAGINDPLQNYLFPASYRQKAGLKRDAINSSLRFDYETSSGYTFSSLSAYHYDKDMTLIDLNFRQETGTGIWALEVQSLSKDYSQEFRIASPQDEALRWSVGVNYLYTDSPGGGVGGTYPFGTLRSSGVTAAKTETPAIFGGVQYDVTEDLTLSVDARYQWDKISRQQIEDRDGKAPPSPAGDKYKATFKSFSPRISLDYQYADNSTVYALFARGYRPGNFNLVLLTRPQSVVDQFAPFGAGKTVDEEKLDNYEIGIKSSWLDSRLQTRLAFYYDPYSKGQNTITIPFTNEFGDLDLASVLINTGKVHLKGFELDFDAAATDNLTISGSLAMADSKIISFFCGDGNSVYGSPDCNGNQLPKASKWTWSLSAEYTSNLTDKYDWFGRVDYAHQGKSFVDYSNVAWRGPQEIVNARLGIRSEELTLEGFVTNLLNDDTPPSAEIGNDLFTFAATNEIRYALPKKRTFGVRAVYNF